MNDPVPWHGQPGRRRVTCQAQAGRAADVQQQGGPPPPSATSTFRADHQHGASRSRNRDSPSARSLGLERVLPCSLDHALHGPWKQGECAGLLDELGEVSPNLLSDRRGGHTVDDRQRLFDVRDRAWLARCG